jgi:hypothetical protein
LWCSVSGWSKITAIGDISSKLFRCFAAQNYSVVFQSKLKFILGRSESIGFDPSQEQSKCTVMEGIKKGNLKKCLFINGWDGMCVCLPVLKKRLINF